MARGVRSGASDSIQLNSKGPIRAHANTGDSRQSVASLGEADTAFRGCDVRE